MSHINHFIAVIESYYLLIRTLLVQPLQFLQHLHPLELVLLLSNSLLNYLSSDSQYFHFWKTIYLGLHFFIDWLKLIFYYLIRLIPLLIMLLIEFILIYFGLFLFLVPLFIFLRLIIIATIMNVITHFEFVHNLII